MINIYFINSFQQYSFYRSQGIDFINNQERFNEMKELFYYIKFILLFELNKIISLILP
ncbi:hypothetical protein DDD_3365 [Nonlabens dokdonensis DSW-6]|uniref:Uncharacterized protein n=1 Tax=Nonlabens dokdonensis (strain DSM 17205 / KCTC 12402 / DSW-6) TaxID=592029 RepID=L7WDZ0_NONDD|nr:hypothetical protein DDD_3365 [Nonlabens dokdonensis DSW-6]